jgi:hypothetical protein
MAAARPLDLEVTRKGRHEDAFRETGDPEDAAWLQGQLRRWLRDNRWAESRWAEFELAARNAGAGKVLAKVKPLWPGTGRRAE